MLRRAGQSDSMPGAAERLHGFQDSITTRPSRCGAQRAVLQATLDAARARRKSVI
jgi:hypothetical protein